MALKKKYLKKKVEPMLTMGIRKVKKWEKENKGLESYRNKLDNLIFYFLTYFDMLCMTNRLKQENLEEIKS